MDEITVDHLLEPYRDLLGPDWRGYRNHCRRVEAFCLAQSPEPPSREDAQRLSIAVAFHDLGIWTADSMDFLPPSVGLAQRYLDQIGKPDWADHIAAMIAQHHKLSPYPNDPWVERVRRADAIDLSLGLLAFGLPRPRLQEIRRHFPQAGFLIGMLCRLGLYALKHPWRPLPMMRL